jgi:prophage tail gpP-like protein
MPKRKETVDLQIGSQVFSAWEQIQATAEFGTLREFAFLATEAVSSSGGQSSPNWSTLQIIPGDDCTVKFAGELFLTGTVNCRNAHYDAFQHNVLISGKSNAGKITDASVLPQDHNGGQFLNQKWQAIATAVLKKQGVQLEMRGSTQLSEMQIDDAQIMPGETTFNFLGRLARHRGITLFDDEHGKVIAYASVTGSSGGSLIEGKNIQSASCRIENTTIFSKHVDDGATNGKDSYWGRRAAQAAAHADNPGAKGLGYKPYLFLGDRRLTTQEAIGRMDYETLWVFNDNITADIVVYGWQSDGGELWKVGDSVNVDSPMLMLKNNKLYIQRVTFTQDNEQGSLASLHVVSRLSSAHLNFDVPGGASTPQPAKPGPG